MEKKFIVKKRWNSVTFEKRKALAINVIVDIFILKVMQVHLRLKLIASIASGICCASALSQGFHNFHKDQVNIYVCSIQTIARSNILLFEALIKGNNPNAHYSLQWYMHWAKWRHKLNFKENEHFLVQWEWNKYHWPKLFIDRTFTLNIHERTEIISFPLTVIIVN